MKIKPGSKRGQVRLRFNAEGQAAADKLAAELGVPESKRKRWFRMWSGEPAPARPKAELATVEPLNGERLSTAAVRALREDPKNRVRYHTASVGSLGTIIQRGPEQSLVRWDNGNECYVVNEWVVPVDQPVEPVKKPGRRKLSKRASQ